MSKKIFITGIGTGIGKTVASAVLCEALHADYWKPVQSGGLEKSDSQIVTSLLSNGESRVHQEAYRLNTPCSPHLAAKIDGVRIEVGQISPPEAGRYMVIEGAGGVMVPLNDNVLILDLIGQLKAPVVVVSKNYLGSINHTLLTLSCLKSRSLQIAGLVFNGESNVESERMIERYSAVPVLGRIPQASVINAEFVAAQAGILRDRLNEFIA